MQGADPDEMEKERAAPAEDAYLICTAPLAVEDEGMDTDSNHSTPGSAFGDVPVEISAASPAEMEMIQAVLDEAEIIDPKLLAMGSAVDPTVSPVGASCLDLGDGPMMDIAGGPMVNAEGATAPDTPAPPAVDMGEEMAEHA